MNCNRSWPSGGPEPPNTWSRTTNSCIANASYSIEDLDMRRKAEVLQYKKNSTNMSKKQKFSYISNNPIGQKQKGIANIIFMIIGSIILPGILPLIYYIFYLRKQLKHFHKYQDYHCPIPA